MKVDMKIGMMTWLNIYLLNSQMLRTDFNVIHGFGFLLGIIKLPLIHLHPISIG